MARCPVRPCCGRYGTRRYEVDFDKRERVHMANVVGWKSLPVIRHLPHHPARTGRRRCGSTPPSVALPPTMSATVTSSAVVGSSAISTLGLSASEGSDLDELLTRPAAGQPAGVLSPERRRMMWDRRRRLLLSVFISFV